MLYSYDFLTKEEAIINLRRIMCEHIKNNHNTNVFLDDLLWDDVNNCFPNEEKNVWSHASFYFNIRTMSLYADLEMYTSAYGRPSGKRIHISAEEFHRIANEYNFSEELKLMESEDDWKSIKDSQLDKAIDELI